MKKTFSLVLAVLCCLTGLSSCRFSKKDNILRYDLASDPRNLDPQTVTDNAGKTVLKHVFEGLVAKNEDGSIHTVCAESYTVSEDGLSYTFPLKKTLTWSNGDPLTADDFVFAFQRLFSPETSAHDYASFLCIKNAEEVLDGKAAPSDLGVRANENTVIFELSYRNQDFLQALTEVYAFPCNRKFFEESRGKYGSDVSFLLYNGKFVISDWQKGKYVSLRQNRKYYAPDTVLSDGINFYTAADNDISQRLLDGTTDLAVLPWEIASTVDTEKFNIREFYTTTWVLGFNQNVSAFCSTAIRQAFTLPLNNINAKVECQADFLPANGILPPDLSQNKSKTDLPTPQSDAQMLFSSGLKEIEPETFPQKLTVLIPDRQEFKLFMTFAQKAWMDNFGIAVNFRALENSDYDSALKSGDFDLALFPLTAESNSPSSIYSLFSSQSSANYLHWESPDFDSILQKIGASIDSKEKEALLSDAEKLLTEEAIVFPVFYQKSFYVLNKRLENAGISPFDSAIDLTNAYKNNRS